jgi:hypothetical protein
LTANTTGTNNTAVGYRSLYSNTTGYSQTAVGSLALNSAVVSNRNTAVGTQAGRHATGYYNVFLGAEAGLGVSGSTTGNSNIAIGAQALDSITSGSTNVAIGSWTGGTSAALGSNTTGASNIAIGSEALGDNTTGTYNTAVGRGALLSNTTASNNTAVGYKSLTTNTTGSNNTANGFRALDSSTTASYNAAFGYYALRLNTTAINNVAMGTHTLGNTTTGGNNTATGYAALNLSTTGINNTATGYDALRLNTTGNNNVGIGAYAGDNITTGSSNIIIGSGVDAPSATASNQLNIGNTIYADMSNNKFGIGISDPLMTIEARTGGAKFGQVYFSSENANTINSGYDANSLADMWINYRGYQDGQTQFRDLRVGNGKGTQMAHFDGDTGRIQFGGSYGTSSYSEKFKVYSTNTYTIVSQRTGTGYEGHMVFQNGNGAVGSIFTNGSGTSYNTSSDYRLKENVVPMSGSIDRLKELKPSRFNFIADADTTVDGFLAHEAQEVVPECVAGTKDAMRDEEYEVTPAVMDGETVVTEAVMGTRSVPDYQGIDQSKLVPLLVASLQEAIARIEVLENA